MRFSHRFSHAVWRWLQMGDRAEDEADEVGDAAVGHSVGRDEHQKSGNSETTISMTKGRRKMPVYGPRPVKFGFRFSKNARIPSW
jgi:hypothetical protein